MNLLLYLHIFYKILDEAFLQTYEMKIFANALIACSYVTVAAKTTNLENLRHSESATDLQQCFYIMCKTKIGTATFLYYIIVTFTFFYFISC